MSRRAIRTGALAALAAAALLVVFLLIRGSGEDTRSVYVTVPDATGMVGGQYVRAGGRIVGKVARVRPARRGADARIEIDLDDSVWPLREGTRFKLRWGGTINLFNRHILLEPGKGERVMVADGGEFPAENFNVPVEYGELINVFDRQLRADTRRLLDRGGAELEYGGKPVNAMLGSAPPALREADAVLSELDYSRADVAALIRSTDRVVDAIDRSSPTLGETIVAAGTTLNAIAADVGALETTLERAPGSLRNVTRTLVAADPTLESAGAVTTNLKPGVRELRRISRPLNHTLGRLLEVSPDLQATLGTAQRSAPDLTRFVDRLGDESPRLGSISSQLDEALNCIRPYSPEIASFGTLWGSALSNTDGKDNYIRAQPTVLLPAPLNLDGRSSADAAKQYPGLTYGFPRPPGTQAGQPWFLPECGAGRDAIDPNKDPEARRPFPKQEIMPEARGKRSKRG